MIRYTSKVQRRSRLADQEARHFVLQTVVILLITVSLVGGLIIFGIPLFIKLAVFLADLRSSSAPIEQLDTIPPATPQLDQLPSATVSASIKLRGYAEPAASIHIYHNGTKTIETITGNDGIFELNRLDLDDGLNRFYVVAVDAAGNESPSSATQTVILDNQAPGLNLIEPADGSAFFGPTQQLITLKGSTDPDNSLTVGGANAVVQPNGNFSINLALKEGDNPYVITATDPAGNETTTLVTFKYYP
jgi:hypothetical protein